MFLFHCFQAYLEHIHHLTSEHQFILTQNLHDERSSGYIYVDGLPSVLQMFRLEKSGLYSRGYLSSLVETAI